MPEREKLLAVAREWMAKAENDLKTAAHALELRDDCPTDTVPVRLGKWRRGELNPKPRGGIVSSLPALPS